MEADVSEVIEPLIKRKIFATEEQAVRELMRDFILRQITARRRELGRFERKYGMSFDQFGEYLHARSMLLEMGGLSPEQRQNLGQIVMQEEDDWLDWKATKEMLESLLGLGNEVHG